MDSKEEKQPQTKEDKDSKIAELEKKLEELTKANKPDYEAKLDKLIEEKVQERLKAKEQDLVNAKRIVQEAEERAELEKQVNENLKYKTKEEKVARYREEILYALNEVVRCGDQRNYNVQVFNVYNDSEEAKQIRDLYIMTKRYGAEKVYNYLAKEYFPKWAIKDKE